MRNKKVTLPRCRDNGTLTHPTIYFALKFNDR